MATLFQGRKNTHQNRLRFRAVLAAVAITVFTHDHAVADRPLRMIVVERDVLMIQKRQQLLPMTPQSFDQPFGFDVFPFVRDQSRQAVFDSFTQSFVLRVFQRRTLAPKPHRVTQNTFQSFRKLRPIAAFVLVLRNFLQIAEQVRQTLLLPGADNRVVRQR